MDRQQLEVQQKEASAIVYRWFRFRARRGLGMLYCLFSFLPVFGTILFALSESLPATLIGATAAGVGLGIIIRRTGLQGFGMMASTMEMMKGKSNPTSLNRSVFLLLFILWPWIAGGLAASFGQTSLAAIFAVVWLVEVVLYAALTVRRTKDPILDSRIEDWLGLIGFPLGAVLSTLPILPTVLHSYGFLLVSPLLLFSGAKSLYDAPKELVVDLDAKQG